MIQEAEEQVHIVREKLKTAQSRQKSQYGSHHKAVTFEVGDKAYLRVTPLKGTHRFGIKGKLAPRYIGPFRILAKRGEVAYQLELPPHLSRVHDVFHFLNSVVASRILSAEWTTKRLISRTISHIENTPFVFLIKPSAPLDATISSFSMFNGHIIQRVKLLGKGRIVFDLSTPPSFRRNPNLGTRFL